MFCNNCGSQISEATNRCRVCGAPVDPRTAEAAMMQVAPAAGGGHQLADEHLARLVAERAELGLLVCVGGSIAGSRFELRQRTTGIGRDPDNHVVLDDITVSRHHAEIERLGPAYVVRDCGSFNGTYLNGERIDEILLDDKDQLRVGRFTLFFFAPRS